MRHRGNCKKILVILLWALAFLTLLLEASFTEPHNLNAGHAFFLRGSVIDAAASPTVSMRVKVLNALTGEAIPNATLIILDLREPRKPEVGRGIYFTNEDGEYNVTE
ncbi:MAG: hypothetical protein QW506_06710, partial [Thermoproteota archaeon]